MAAVFRSCGSIATKFLIDSPVEFAFRARRRPRTDFPTSERLAMTFTTWLAFAAASTVLLMIPGPTVLLVVSYALTQGRRVAFATAIGVALGDFTAMTLSLAGLGAILLASSSVFTGLKWIGAAYLVYLGIKLWRAEPVLAEAELSPRRGEARQILGHAFVVTSLNPKSIAFFVAFVPQFIDRQSALLPQLVLMEATFVILATLNALFFAYAADSLRARIRRTGVLTWLESRRCVMSRRNGSGDRHAKPKLTSPTHQTKRSSN